MQVVRKPAYSILTEFSSGDASSRSEPSIAELEANAVERIEAAAEEAFQRGFAAGQEEAHRDFEKRSLILRSQFDERIAKERETLLVGQAGTLANQIDAGLHSLATKIETDVAALLKPWLSDRMHQQALGLFYAAVTKAAAGSAAICLQGPQPFLDEIKKGLSGQDVRTIVTNGDDANVVVTMDDTMIDVNLTAWMASWEHIGP